MMLVNERFDFRRLDKEYRVHRFAERGHAVVNYKWRYVLQEIRPTSQSLRSE